MHFRNIGPFVAAFFAIGAAQSGNAAVTFGSASLKAYSYNIIGDPLYNIDGTDAQMVSLGSPDSASASASSNANTRINTGFPFSTFPLLSSSSSIRSTVSFASPASVDLSVSGSMSQLIEPSPRFSYALGIGSTYLDYQFTIDSDYDFIVSRTAMSAGSYSSAGLTLWDLSRSPGEQDVMFRIIPGNGPFTVGATLGAGSYRAFLDLYFSNQIVGDQGSQSDIGFSGRSLLHITPFVPPAVPEPASWALLISGMGLAGANLRRRRFASAESIRLV